jgi:uncharacterized protein
MTEHRLTAAEARRFQAHALGLDQPFADVASALRHLGYVQIDPINVCGRMHDLILRPRVQAYHEGALMEYLHGEPRGGFEHYLPGKGILVALPFEAWPCLAPAMEARRRSTRGYACRLNRREEDLARHILNELRDRGPLTSDGIEHDGQTRTAWGSNAREVKTLLERLFIHGRVLIHGRRNFRRIYDLPERVLPEAVRQAPVPAAEERARWLAVLGLRQRRLAHLPRKELPPLGDRVVPLEVENCPLPLYCLREDLPLIEAAKTQSPPPHARLLAPLDPLLYDRKVTARVWDFHYTWEVYTPPARRVRGYYALPVLAGDALVGHVDPKADRKERRLRVVGRQLQPGHAVAPAVRELARFLYLKTR